MQALRVGIAQVGRRGATPLGNPYKTKAMICDADARITMMKHWLMALTLTVPLVGAGCSGTQPDDKPKAIEPSGSTDGGKAVRPDEKEARIDAALAKLSVEDRKLAEEQRYCAVQSKNRLGSMGPPEKVLVKGQPVFICCEGCRDKALADPDKTLAKAQELKKAAESGAK